MNKTTTLTCTLIASLSVSTVAHALCVELTTYRPWDPAWLGSAIRTTSTSAYAALRAVGEDSARAARFQSDATTAVAITSNASSRAALWAKAESPTGYTSAVWAESAAPSGAVVELIGGTSGSMIDAHSGGQSVFRVDTQGMVTVRGAPILQKGPKGGPGRNGADGARGGDGRQGNNEGMTDFAACVQQSCWNVCLHGVVSSDTSPCTATNSQNRFCNNNNVNGYCCVCAKP